MVFFFFQAEDGIRDKLVTGVQTCALPIFEPRRVEPREHRHARELRRFLVNAHVGGPPSPSSTTARSRGRSEERRVGKECRSRWRAYDEEKETRMSREIAEAILKNGGCVDV